MKFLSRKHVIHYRNWTEQHNNIILDVNVIRKQVKFITSVYRKPTFSGVHTHFDSFLTDTYKIGMIYTLVNRCFQIWFSWWMFHQQLILLREIFQKNGYPENFIDRCFKLFLNRINILKEKVSAVEKKPLRLAPPHLGTISLQTRTKLQKLIKWYLTAVNYRLFLKVKINSVIIFALKTLLPNFLQQVWFISFSVNYAMNLLRRMS